MLYKRIEESIIIQKQISLKQALFGYVEEIKVFGKAFKIERTGISQYGERIDVENDLGVNVKAEIIY